MQENGMRGAASREVSDGSRTDKLEAGLLGRCRVDSAMICVLDSFQQTQKNEQKTSGNRDVALMYMTKHPVS